MTMPLKSISSCVAIGLLLLLVASPLAAQGPEGMQIFSPADNSTYGGGNPPNEGYFFQFDGLYWAISAPKTAQVGSLEDAPIVYYPTGDGVPEHNTFNTAGFKTQFSIGNRFEFGRIEDRNGWMMSIYQLRNQGAYSQYPVGDVVFHDVETEPGIGLLAGYASAAHPNARLPVQLYNVTLSNDITTWGVEAMYIHRFHTGHNGGTFEFFGRVRYLEFNENFGFQSGEAPFGVEQPSFMEGSSWFTLAENHLIGPQIGGRWFKKQGRWTISTEGRFMGALNYQNFHQNVYLPVSGQGTMNHPTNMPSVSTTHDSFASEFAPLIELRLEAKYQITRALSFRAGWTGFWTDGIARASSVVSYNLPDMGINMSNNRQNLFVNGLTIGFDVNR